MTNLLPFNDRSKNYIQAIEKQEDNLTLRKQLALQHWLTSISDFVEGRAISRKADKRMLINPKGEFLMDEDPTITARLKVSLWAALDQQRDEEKQDYTNTRHDTAPIVPVQTTERIFPAKDGIIIVADNLTSRHSTVRLYTTEGKRIPIPEGWKFYNRHTKNSEQDTKFIDGVKYGAYSNNIPWYSQDREAINIRETIVHGMIPIQPEIDRYHELHDSHNILHNECICLLKKDGTLFTTDTGKIFATETARPLDGEYLPGLDTSKTIRDKSWFPTGVHYMVKPDGTIFRDEFDNIVYTISAYWTQNFKYNEYVPVIQTTMPNRILSINKNGVYKKGSEDLKNRKYIRLYPIKKKLSDNTIVDDRNRSYQKINHNTIRYLKKENVTEAAVYDALSTTDYNTDIFWFCDCELNPIDPQTLQKDQISFDHGHGEHIIHALDTNIWAIGYNAIADHYHASTSYSWYQYIINKRFNNQKVHFPDKRELQIHTIDDYTYYAKHQAYHIIHENIEPTGEYRKDGAIIIINGLIARYAKDEYGKELKNMYRIVSVFDKYIYIQEHEKGPRVVLNNHLQYLKDTNNNIRSFEYPPIRQEGVFMEYNYPEEDPKGIFNGSNVKLQNAYFPDGTRVGDPITHNQTTDHQINHRTDLLKLL